MWIQSKNDGVLREERVRISCWIGPVRGQRDHPTLGDCHHGAVLVLDVAHFDLSVGEVIYLK